MKAKQAKKFYMPRNCSQLQKWIIDRIIKKKERRLQKTVNWGHLCYLITTQIATQCRKCSAKAQIQKGN